MNVAQDFYRNFGEEVCIFLLVGGRDVWDEAGGWPLVDQTLVQIFAIVAISIVTIDAAEEEKGSLAIVFSQGSVIPKQTLYWD